MKKSWTNSNRLARNHSKVHCYVVDRETADVINILEAERKRLVEAEYMMQRMSFRMRHPYQTPKRVHQGRASRLIKMEIADLVAGKRTPDEALQILVHDEVERSRRDCYLAGY